MKTLVGVAAISVALIGLVACNDEVPATPVVADAPVAQAPAAKPKVAATVIDSTMFGYFLIVPSSGDTGTILADGSAYEIRSVGVGRAAAGDGNGALVRVSAETATQLTGRTVKVTVTARSSATNGSPMIKLMYSRPGSGSSSNWHDFTMTADYAPYSFEYLVPTVASETGWDNIAFWADPEGKRRGIDVSGVAVETVD